MLRMRLLSLTPHPLFSIQDTLHALRIDPADTKLSPSRRDLAQRLAPALQGPAAGYSGLLLRVLDKVTVLALALDVVSERALAAVEQQLRGAVALGVAHALANPVALVLGHRRQNRENQLGNAVAGDVAATGSGFAIAFYILFCAVVSIVAVMMMPDYTNKDISEEHDRP